jgi:hypothetical protein
MLSNFEGWLRSKRKIFVSLKELGLNYLSFLNNLAKIGHNCKAMGVFLRKVLVLLEET